MSTMTISRIASRAAVLVTSALVVTLSGGCATSPIVPPEVRGQLASAGKLRVGLIMSNQVLVSRDTNAGELRGVTVTLGKALAQRLGVPFEAVQYPNPAALVKSFGAAEWDIAFLAFDPARAQEVVFSPPYMEVDNTYLVPANSKVQSVERADQPGVTIAVPERSAPDLYLSRNLKSAKVLRITGSADEVVRVLSSGSADAYAENAHMLTLFSHRLPGSRVLDGRYTVIQHAIATAKGKAAAAEYVKAFVEDSKANGTVANAIEAAGLHRTRVAVAQRQGR